MRRFFIGMIFGLLASVALNSCMKDEPLNAECDIEQVTIHCDNPGAVFFNLGDSIKDVLFTDTVVTFNVRRDAPLAHLTPKFKITEGATVEPLDGEVHDFSKNKSARYKVTSQDGKWSRVYTLTINPVTRTVNDTVKFDFEKYELEAKNKKYYIWHNLLNDGSLGNDWASGNGGFQLSMSSAKPDEYPTVPDVQGFDGACVKLTTRSTGAFGALVNKRLAAGNFFLGEFDVASAMRNPMQATRFGIPFDMKPVKIIGYYKYIPGAVYQDQAGNPVEGKIDEGAIYSVFYANRDATGNAVLLHGDDVKNNGNIVAIAEVMPVKTVGEWRYFEAEFVYNKDVDMKMLENRGYNITVVFSSSAGGATFQGAVGSELWIDKVRLICTKEE